MTSAVHHCTAWLHTCCVALLTWSALPARSEVLDIVPAGAADPPHALRVVNLSKMPATVRSLTWRVPGSGSASPCSVALPMTLVVPAGASVLLPSYGAPNLLACLRADRSARVGALAGFSRAPITPGTRAAAVDIDAKFDLPRGPESQTQRLNVHFR